MNKESGDIDRDYRIDHPVRLLYFEGACRYLSCSHDLLEELIAEPNKLVYLFSIFESLLTQIEDKVLTNDGKIMKKYRKSLKPFCAPDGKLIIMDNPAAADVFIALAKGAITNRFFTENLAKDKFLEEVLVSHRLSERLKKVLPDILRLLDKKGKVDSKYEEIVSGFLIPGHFA